jgi:hypothetical protein
LSEVKLKEKAQHINFAYSELAKQLKTSKSFKDQNVNGGQNSFNVNNGKFKSVNYNLLKSSSIANERNISSNIRTNLINCTSTGMTKTTKDNSMASLKISTTSTSVKKAKLDFEGPEELHLFYINLHQQNKHLAFKFENVEMEKFNLEEFNFDY